MRAKVEREVQHIIDTCLKEGRKKKECEKIAWGHVNKQQEKKNESNDYTKGDNNNRKR